MQTQDRNVQYSTVPPCTHCTECKWNSPAVFTENPSFTVPPEHHGSTALSAPDESFFIILSGRSLPETAEANQRTFTRCPPSNSRTKTSPEGWEPSMMAPQLPSSTDRSQQHPQHGRPDLIARLYAAPGPRGEGLSATRAGKVIRASENRSRFVAPQPEPGPGTQWRPRAPLQSMSPIELRTPTKERPGPCVRV